MIVVVSETGDESQQSPLDHGLGTLPGQGSKLWVFMMSPDGEAFATAEIDRQNGKAKLGSWAYEVMPRTD